MKWKLPGKIKKRKSDYDEYLDNLNKNKLIKRKKSIGKLMFIFLLIVNL